MMLDNKNRVLGTLAVRETTGGALKSRSIRLHDATSYVALSVSSVNGNALTEPKYAYTRVIWMAVYFVLASAISYLLFWYMHHTASEIFRMFGSRMPRRIGVSFFVLPSLLIGLSSLGVLLRGRYKNDIRMGGR